MKSFRRDLSKGAMLCLYMAKRSPFSPLPKEAYAVGFTLNIVDMVCPVMERKGGY